MIFAAFLDPRIKVNLALIMLDDNYKGLIRDIQDKMISMNEVSPNDINDDGRSNDYVSNRGPRTKKRKDNPSVFDNFDSGGSNDNQNDRNTTRQEQTSNEIQRIWCEMELNTCMKTGILQFHCKMQMENFIILSAGISLKGHYNSLI